MSKFTFGAPTTSATSTSFSFPVQQQAGAFGATSTFGATGSAAAPSMAQPTATPGLNFSFGNTATVQPAATQPTLNTGLFGATTNQPQQSQLAQQLAQPIQQTTGLTFGTPTAAAKPTGLTFGTPTVTTTQTTGLSFNPPTATSGGLSFGLGTSGTAAGTGGGIAFGAAPTTSGLSFGTTTSTAAVAPTTSGLGFGTTLAANTGLNFGATSTAGTGLSFGATPTSSTASSLFNTSTLFGAKPATTAPAVTTAPTTTTNRGLGGLDVSVTNKGLTQGNVQSTSAKENLLPNELMQTIDSFKEFVKTQKSLSSDIARGSVRPLNRCAEDTASLMEILTTLAGSVQRDRSLTDRLKCDTANALHNAEIAQRTHDTPPGLQYENNAPLLFFMELAEQFENDLMLFKQQIESTEKHIQTMMTPKTLTPQELTMAMNKLHESLVAVAGKLQGVHSKVQQQKEQYLNFRKYVLKDTTNVFEDIRSDGNSSRSIIGKVTSGPTPFGPGNRSFLSSSSLNPVQTPSYGNPNPLGKN
ncbi:probable nucleoporin Nup58 isoform X2 [Copidosoma floridanum]|uniref:probable nucleoporin Nup58 isoform X2 n=1 Tax=Copidosoma floridanum TaxID=29053 RepID=UPI0006C98837|nr:probable nucleoporin Nup58 isoform X2 [Copidosoma floridanum]